MNEDECKATLVFFDDNVEVTELKIGRIMRVRVDPATDGYVGSNVELRWADRDDRQRKDSDLSNVAKRVGAFEFDLDFSAIKDVNAGRVNVLYCLSTEGQSCEVDENCTIPMNLQRLPGSQGEPLTSVITFPNRTIPVTLNRAAADSTPDQCLWDIIRTTSEALAFPNFTVALAEVSRQPAALVSTALSSLNGNWPFTDAASYRQLKHLAEAFIVSKGSVLDNPPDGIEDCSDYLKGGEIPYLVAVAAPYGGWLESFAYPPEINEWREQIQFKLARPYLVELIYTYWLEEGMIFQSMGAISRRFQNVAAPGPRDPLAGLEIGPLRPLSNLIWGFIQDEQHRLSLVRRAYEYDHQYGLQLQGQALPALRPAESRSKFLEGFHNLLSLCSQFFRQFDDTTVVADGFPLLNALRDVHLILSIGGNNQFRDLPVTSRIELLVQQYLLSRSEFRDYLPRREMVAYPETWMGSIDSMKALQGWTDVSILHFNSLAVFGEQIVLSIRYGNWLATGASADQAVNWAREWRAEIQGYIYAYRVVTGIDLSSETVDSRQEAARNLPPSVHITRRLAAQQRPQPVGMNGARPKPHGVPARSVVPR